MKSKAMTLLEAALPKYAQVDMNLADDRYLRDTAEDTFKPAPNMRKLRDALLWMGQILEENLDEQYYIAALPAAALIGGRALAVVCIENGAAQIAAYSREGLIRADSARRAVDRVLKQLSDIH